MASVYAPVVRRGDDGDEMRCRGRDPVSVCESENLVVDSRPQRQLELPSRESIGVCIDGGRGRTVADISRCNLMS